METAHIRDYAGKRIHLIGIGGSSMSGLAEMLMDQGYQVSGSDRDGYAYAIGRKDGDLRGFVKELNAALNGRGGGKPGFAQGRVAAKRAEIEEYFAK